MMESRGGEGPSPQSGWGRIGVFLDVPNWETGLHDRRCELSATVAAGHAANDPNALLNQSARAIRARVASRGPVVIARAYGRCYIGNGSSPNSKGPTLGLLAADREGFAPRPRFVSGSQSEKREDVDMPLYRDIAEAVYRDLVDTVVVVSGDGDMTYVAETVKGCGKRFVSMFWSESANRRLLAFADDFEALDGTAGVDSRLVPTPKGD